MSDALNDAQRKQLKLLVELDPFLAQEVVQGALVRRVQQAEARAIEAQAIGKAYQECIDAVTPESELAIAVATDLTNTQEPTHD
jgi:hypothetical protein